jgi:2'-5' RNA ligase
MDKNIQQLPGYQVNEYKLILVPHEALAKHIQDVRKVFTDKFSIENPSSSIPQVLLASFKQIHAAEERILNRLRIVAMANPAFKVELKDFGSFPSHTIFINVTSKVPIGNLIKKVKSDVQRLMKLDADNKPYFPTDSHINIALKLKPWQYENAWLEYEKKHFTGRFIADHMVLLRRREGEFKYKVIESFKFENMPVEVKQGELF